MNFLLLKNPIASLTIGCCLTLLLVACNQESAPVSNEVKASNETTPELESYTLAELRAKKALSGSNEINRETTPEPIESSWTYSKYEDEMGKGKSHYAVVESSNTVNFNSPYSGEQHATLTLRTHPRHGKDLIFKIEKGQILCPSYDGCSVLVRFDDGVAVNYSALPAADHNTETLFIENYNKFLGKLQKSKRLRISANIYQQGSPVFEFDISNFDSIRYKSNQ